MLKNNLPDEMLYTNGIDGFSGRYLHPPIVHSKLAKLIKGEPIDNSLKAFFKNIWQKISQPHLGLPHNISAEDVTQAGWGIIFHKNEDPVIKETMRPLINHRKQQVADDKFKVLEHDGSITLAQWLVENGVSLGSMTLSKVPYYLLIVGSPEKIPFAFGHQLSADYAVGRIHFDEPHAYEQYVSSIIAYENGYGLVRAKKAVFFGTHHKLDKATELSTNQLIRPLCNKLSSVKNKKIQEYNIHNISGAPATKEALTNLFSPTGGDVPPAFIFTATHGIGFKAPQKSYQQQKAANGAIVCQDWPGAGSIDKKHYFSAHDLPSSSKVHGLISFHFACHSAGSPTHDRFSTTPGTTPPRIAEESFISELPKALLSHPQGGALACIGHVDRVWSFSFTDSKAGSVIQPFENSIELILDGKPVGYAIRDFNARYAQYSVIVADLFEKLSFNYEVSTRDLAKNWAKRNNAEGYMIIGDPAVRIMTENLINHESVDE